jgi:hypothetical protein
MWSSKRLAHALRRITVEPPGKTGTGDGRADISPELKSLLTQTVKLWSMARSPVGFSVGWLLFLRYDFVFRGAVSLSLRFLGVAQVSPGLRDLGL